MRLLVMLVLLAATRADAKPRSTKLDQLLAESTTIAIAAFDPVPDPYRATGYTLHVERALRGTAKGAFAVKPAPYGHASFGGKQRLLAFVNANQEWIAYGALIAGPSLEDGVIRLAGFNDENAHYVSPGVVTLSGLERLVTKGTPMTWVFTGRVELAATAYKPLGWRPGFVEEAIAVGPLGCTYTAAGKAQPCTLRYVATKFARP